MSIVKTFVASLLMMFGICVGLWGSVPIPATSTAPVSVPATRKVESDDVIKEYLSKVATNLRITDAAIQVDGEKCRMSLSATTSKVGRIVAGVESTDLAIRISSLKIQAKKAGTDDLALVMVLDINVPKPADSQLFSACFRDVSTSFGTLNGIWATTFASTEDGWQLSGQCVDEKLPGDLRAKLAADDHFGNVKLNSVTQNKPDAHFSFSISFAYKSINAKAEK